MGSSLIKRRVRPEPCPSFFPFFTKKGERAFARALLFKEGATPPSYKKKKPEPKKF